MNKEKSLLVTNIILGWSSFIGGVALCWIFGNFWIALGVFLISLSTNFK